MKGVITLLFLFNIHSVLALEIGSVSLIKGDVFKLGHNSEGKRIKKRLKKGLSISEGDHVITKTSSVLKVILNDKTIISLGANSQFVFKKHHLEKGGRRSIYNLLKGRMRAIVKKRSGKSDSLQFNGAKVSLGVRGTEFLVNAYKVGKVPTNDVSLLKGRLWVNASKANSTLKPFELTAGKQFNTNELRKMGMKAIKNIPLELMNKLNMPGHFMPSLQSPSGAFLTGAATGILAAAGGLILNDNEKEKEDKKGILRENSPMPEVAPVQKKGLESKLKGHFSYQLKDEPWDIRENVQKFKKRSKENECFYFFYKSLPGGGEPERFRRSRNCDEFEFDL